jgi:uncharacterized protein
VLRVGIDERRNDAAEWCERAHSVPATGRENGEPMADFNGNLFAPILFRALQTALEAAPTLLCGLVLAGLLRGMIGPETLRRWFTKDLRIGPIRAGLIGLLLPVCSFGVLPVAWELRRAGVARATVLTFLLTAPLVNPISLAYAIQKLESHGAVAVSAFLGLLLGAFAILIGVGVLLGRWLPEPVAAPADLPPLPASDLRRVAVVGLTAARGVTGILLLFLFVGLLGSGLLALYPGGALEQAANDRSPWTPLHMALVALPSQVPPHQGGLLLGEMLLMGVSFGVAFVFLLLGIGLNLGTLVWIARAYGFQVLAYVLPLVVGATLVVGYALPLALPNLAPASARGRHFLEIESTGGAEIARARALEDNLINDKGEPQWLGIATCAALGILVLVGLVCRMLGERAAIRRLMTQPSGQTTSPPGSAWNKHLSAPQLTGAGLIFLLVVAVAVLYLSYPSPEVVLDEMNGVQIELNLTLKTDPLARQEALRLVALWQRLQGKLGMGDFLRRGRFESPLRQPSEDLRVGIERLRAALVEMKPADELNALYAEARKAATRCRQAMEPGREP